MGYRLALAAILTMLLLAGCAQMPSPYARQTRAETTSTPLASAPVGQTFQASAAGLSAVEISLVGGRPEDGPLRLHLRASPTEQRDLRAATIARATLPMTGTYRWSFAPLWDSQGRDYYLRVELPDGAAGQGQSLSISTGDAYPSGQLYRAEQPLAGDLVFTAYYDGGAQAALRYALKLSGRYPSGVWALLFLLFVPGALLMRLLRISEQSPLVQAAVAMGLSLALVPLLLLLADVLGMRLGARLLRTPALIMTLAALGLWLRDRPWQQPGWRRAWLRTLPIVAVLLIAAWIRLLHMRGLAGPQWVDAPQHAAELSLILRDGGLPQSYAPYLADARPVYHFGYHALAAQLIWLSGLSIPQALLVAGQVLSAAIPLSCAGLAIGLGGRRAGGLIAALAVGCIFLLPAYFVSWSTYTRVAGLALLPVACLLAQRWIAGGSRALALAAAVAAAGLALTHYYVAVLYGAFVLALLLCETVLCWRRERAVLRLWSRVTALAIVALLLALPWFMQTTLTTYVQEQPGFTSQRRIAEAAEHSSLLLYGDGGRLLLPQPPELLSGLLGAERGLAWLLLSPITAAVLVACLRRERYVPHTLLWIALIFIAGLGYRRGMLRLIDQVGLYSMLSVPISVAFGLAAGGLLEALGARLRGATRLLVGAAALGLVLWLAVAGGRELLLARNTNTVLLAEPDLRAFAWAREHLPHEALVLINAFPWQTDIVAGSDGGAWLTPLTGRRALPAPILYRFGSRELRARMARIGELSYSPPPAEELWRKLQAEGITHIYLGWRVTSSWGGATLRAEELLQSEHFKPIYKDDGAWIFTVAP